MAIIRRLNHIARQLKREDRVLIFFAGHGYTETFGGQDFGYIVPYDGNDTSTYISVDQLREFSRKMRAAKHQLFIMDACYAGLMVDTRAGAIDDGVFGYLVEITRRPARQVLMAGGKGQQVIDNGPDGHSVFTGYLLKALEEREADLNQDGYVTFPELMAYLLPAASNSFQTPAGGYLYEHQLGEFVFSVGNSHKDIGRRDSEPEGAKLRSQPEHKTEVFVPGPTPKPQIVYRDRIVTPTPKPEYGRSATPTPRPVYHQPEPQPVIVATPASEIPDNINTLIAALKYDATMRYNTSSEPRANAAEALGDFQ